MTIFDNSYGTVADVAALTSRWTKAGAYDTTTRPTLAIVEGWINQVSASVNVLLAEKGFTIPITQADAILAIETVVIEAVSELCNVANSTGRFFTDKSLTNGKAPMVVIRTEMADWIDQHARGFEAIGAERLGKWELVEDIDA